MGIFIGTMAQVEARDRSAAKAAQAKNDCAHELILAALDAAVLIVGPDAAEKLMDEIAAAYFDRAG